MIIRPGDMLTVSVGCTGGGHRNRPAVAPPRLRIQMPCCHHEQRPDYADVVDSIARYSEHLIRCRECRHWWRITEVIDMGERIDVTMRA